MQKILLFLLLGMPILGFSKMDTTLVSSEITDVSVFFSGAQVIRTANIPTKKGKQLIKLSQLPYEINAQSIQVKGMDRCQILSVKHELVYPSQSNKDASRIEKENRIEAQEIRIKEIKNSHKVFELEEKILLDNSDLSSEKGGASIAVIKEAADFYRQRLNEIKKQKLQLAVSLEKANEELQQMYKDLNRQTAQKNQVYSEILISLECESIGKAKLDISYYVPSAAWSPTYDFRVEDINQPLQIVYNANVYQSSGENWKNVNLKLSTNNPSLSGTIPELEPWYLERGRNKVKPRADRGSASLQGRVFDAANNEALAFANIVLLQNNEQIAGTSTDFDGQYTLKPIAPGNYELQVHYIGYHSSKISNLRLSADKVTFQNVYLNQAISLSELEIVEYAAPQIEYDRNASGATVTREEFERMPAKQGLNIRGARSAGEDIYIDGVKVVGSTDYIPHSIASRISSIEYVIDLPYTIPSDGKDYSIKIKESKIPVDYIYHAVPKLETDVFLTAEVTDWAELNLLSANSNIYFQGTYTGKAYIDVDQTGDTLVLSLGRDNAIVVEREFNKELKDKKLIGSNVKESVAWNINIRNNKDVGIKIIVEDQFPISERKSVEVERLEYSNAKLEDKSGKLSWELNLAPKEKKKLSFKYSVKYPQGSFLYLE